MTNTQKAAMQQALDALEISLPAKCADQPDRLYLQERDKHRTAIAALREALAAPANQLDDINVADMGAPQPVQQEPVAWVWNPASEAWERVHVFGFWQPGAIYAFGPTPPADPQPATQPAPQQDPDALHLAAMDLARKQMDRIEALEAEVTRFRTDAMNEKSARKAMEQQLAARVPLTDEQIKILWEKSTGQKLPNMGPSVGQLLSVTRAIEAAHGITKGAS